jgi:hypothetical protein
MPMICPFCTQENAAAALVCASCSRDIAVPAGLIGERDGLIRKRDAVRQELANVRRELEELKRGKKRRFV